MTGSQRPSGEEPAPYIAVCGAGEAGAGDVRAAEEVGRLVAEAGAVLVCGGLGGVMEAAARGARSAGGMTIGLLPGADRRGASPWLSVSIPTGMGELRNGLIARACDALIAVGGGWGTLSEVALARKMGRRVVLLGAGRFEPLAEDGEVVVAADPPGAVRAALEDPSG